VIEHDPALLPLVEQIGRFARYVKPDPVKPDPVKPDGALWRGSDGKFDRMGYQRSYMREYMREKRAKGKS
jgi:hypothetical protein